MKERKQPQDRHVDDEPGTQPKKYYKGLSIKDKEARAKHFAKGGKGPAPGDENDDGDKVKTKPSKHTLKFNKMFGESNPDKSLNDKAKKSGISVSILKQVFKRGVKAWQTGHRPGTTAVQWGHARVNSFITKGKGTWGKADKDLADKVRKTEQVEGVSRAQQAAIAISKKEKAGKPGYDKEGKKIKEDIEEGKLVSSVEQILDIITKKLKSEMGKRYKKNEKDGMAFINSIAKMVGMKTTDKSQEKGRLFLKLSESVELQEKRSDIYDDDFRAKVKFNLRQKMMNVKKLKGKNWNNDLKDLQKHHDSIVKLDRQIEKDRKIHNDLIRKSQRFGVPMGEEQDESLWDNIRKKRERIKKGSGEKMRKKGDKGAPTAAQMKQAESLWDNIRKKRARIAKGSGEKMGQKGSVSKKQFDTSVKFSDNPSKVAAAKARKNKIKGKAKK